MSRSQPRVDAYWLGSVPYRDAWALQRWLVDRVRAGETPDTLLLLEHPHVFTLGRRGTEEHVLWDINERAARNVELVHCDRGGDVTYHGPGQLVGYPILDLKRHGGDILVYLRRLEESLIRYLATHELECAAVPGLTGVWCRDEKIAAIGVRLTDTVVSHGFALNLTTDLDYFGGIVPCGLHDKRATSISAQGRGDVPTASAARAYASFFADAFGAKVTWQKENPPFRVNTQSDLPLDQRGAA